MQILRRFLLFSTRSSVVMVNVKAIREALETTNVTEFKRFINKMTKKMVSEKLWNIR